MIDKLNEDSLLKVLLEQKLNPLSMPSICYQNSFSNGKVLSEIIADQFNVPIISACDLNIEILGLPIVTSNIGNNYATSAAKAYVGQAEKSALDLSEVLSLKQSGNLFAFIFDLLIN